MSGRRRARFRHPGWNCATRERNKQRVLDAVSAHQKTLTVLGRINVEGGKKLSRRVAG